MDELHVVLTDMLAGIDANGGSGETSEGGKTLSEHLQKIESLRVDLAGDLPTMLAHYLEKRSYTKALDFLEGRDQAAAPNC